MARGGWREGAGRKGTRPKLESTPSIHVGQWKRAGMLSPGASGLWGWTNGAGLAWLADDLALKLGTIGRDGRPVQQCVALQHTPCGLGGMRAWFTCPDCLRRVGALYLGGAGMACRHCLGLIYSSQCASDKARAWQKAGLLPVRQDNCGARVA